MIVGNQITLKLRKMEIETKDTVIVEKFCNECKKKISQREVSIDSKFNELFKVKHYCEDCTENKKNGI